MLPAILAPERVPDFATSHVTVTKLANWFKFTAVRVFTQDFSVVICVNIYGEAYVHDGSFLVFTVSLAYYDYNRESKNTNEWAT